MLRGRPPAEQAKGRLTAGSAPDIDQIMTQLPGATLEIVRGVDALRDRVAAWRGSGARIGLVPTMGGIHDGHLALVRAARAESDRVVVSLFINPTQFGPAEDLAGYPRDEAGDAEAVRGAGADLMFAPGVDEMYPRGFATMVSVSSLSDGLCGDHRPGHFAGVATVVAKLFAQVRPDAAWFGEKDYQQLLVIRRLAADLDCGVDVIGVPTVREADGLAMSSRNAYLTPEERRVAPLLFRTLTEIATRIAGGGADIGEACAQGRSTLLEGGFAAIDYLEARDAETLLPLIAASGPARVFVAARLGKARLIDNVPIPARG